MHYSAYPALDPRSIKRSKHNWRIVRYHYTDTDFSTIGRLVRSIGTKKKGEDVCKKLNDSTDIYYSSSIFIVCHRTELSII